MISICIICKNEEQNIEHCLKSFDNIGYEIVVVDTGSTDNTKEIAMKYTANVYDFEWRNDFAVAKNFAISKASNDFVMVIDSDEYLEQIDMKLLESMLKDSSEKVGRIQQRNIFHRNEIEQENWEWINRIFSKKYFHYEGRIHEQLVAVDGNDKYETYQAPVTILHSGYDLSDVERKKKAERNISLLNEELQQLILKYGNLIENTFVRLKCNDSLGCVNELLKVLMNHNESTHRLQRDERIPYVLYQLGKSYYMAGNYHNACVYFECGLYFDLNPKLEYVIDMVETYGYALLNSGQAKQALFMENIYDEFGETADFKFLMGLIYMNNERYKEAIGEFEKATNMSCSRTIGTNSYLANYNIGVIYECLGDLKHAKEFYKKCGEYALACRRLHELMSTRVK